MNIRIFAVIVIVLSICIGPVSAQIPSATISNLVIEFEESGTGTATFDLVVENAKEREIGLFMWAIYADSGNPIPTQHSDPLYHDIENNFVTRNYFTVKSDYEVMNDFVVRIPSGAFPLGDYDWYPEIIVMLFPEGVWLIDYNSTDPVHHQEDLNIDEYEPIPEEMVAVNKSFIKIHGESITLVFDLDLSGISAGTELTLIGLISDVPFPNSVDHFMVSEPLDIFVEQEGENTWLELDNSQIELTLEVPSDLFPQETDQLMTHVLFYQEGVPLESSLRWVLLLRDVCRTPQSEYAYTTWQHC